MSLPNRARRRRRKIFRRKIESSTKTPGSLGNKAQAAKVRGRGPRKLRMIYTEPKPFNGLEDLFRKRAEHIANLERSMDPMVIDGAIRSNAEEAGVRCPECRMIGPAETKHKPGCSYKPYVPFFREYPPGFWPTEEQEQRTLVERLRLAKVPHFAVPNGGGRSKREGHVLKSTGVSPGVPDLVIPCARGRYHGLYLEMKRTKKYKVEQPQKDWQELLQDQGYCSEVAVGADAAWSVVEAYLALGPFRAGGPSLE